MINIINATDTPIKIVDKNTNVLFTFEPTEYKSNIEKKLNVVETVDSIEIVSVEYGAVTGLPKQNINTFYIVSSEIHDNGARLDLVCPDQIIDNPENDAILCRTFRI